MEDEKNYELIKNWDPMELLSILAQVIEQYTTSENLCAQTDEQAMKPSLYITEEPNEYFRFAFKSDIKRGIGAVIRGKRAQNRNKTYPSVRFISPCAVNEEFYLLCNLYETSAYSRSLKLSPHLLVAADCNDLHCAPILQPLQKIPGTTEGEYVWELKDYCIVRTKEDDKRKVLRCKYEELLKIKLHKPELNTTEQNQLANLVTKKYTAQKKGSKSLCLGYMILTKHHNLFTPVLGPVFSSGLQCGDLSIRNICNTHGSVNGGTDVTLLVNGLLDNNVQVRVYETAAKRKVLWSALGQITSYSENLITFKTPKYAGDWPDEHVGELICRVQLKRDEIYSPSVKFVYVNDATTKSAKRARTSIEPSRVATEIRTPLQPGTAFQADNLCGNAKHAPELVSYSDSKAPWPNDINDLIAKLGKTYLGVHKQEIYEISD